MIRPRGPRVPLVTAQAAGQIETRVHQPYPRFEAMRRIHAMATTTFSVPNARECYR